MTDHELHPYVELIAREAKRPVVTDPAARARIMAAVRAEGPVRRPSVWERMFEARSLTLSPARTALIAAGLVGIGVAAGLFANNRGARISGGQPLVAVATPQPPVSPDTVVRFVFVAPRAAKVSVVGDFNGWNDTKTPMVRASNNGTWSVTLPMTAGRHLYGFVVDGAWTADPSAPLAPDDGFGHANSVKLVSRGATL
ncbi:MAG: isoamylase early set domain-containing protein [Gemmatimonadaceae bacterium]